MNQYYARPATGPVRFQASNDEAAFRICGGMAWGHDLHTSTHRSNASALTTPRRSPRSSASSPPAGGVQ